MYKYSNSGTTIEDDHQHQSTPLLSSSLHSNTNYSSLLNHQQSPENYANSISAAIEDDNSYLHEQDNELIRRRQTRSNSTITTTSLLQQQKSLSQQQNTTTAAVNNDNNTSILSHSFWQSIFDKFSTSVYLENKGSVARDHLANERTYLAWLRTSLSTISVGIGITQLFRLERTMMHHPPQAPPPPTKHHNTSLLDGQMIGLIFIFISMLFLIFAFIRYFHAQVAMVHGCFPASRSTVAIASLLLFSTMVLMLIAVIRQQQ